MSKKIVLLPGDGIDQEVINSAKEVLDKVAETYQCHFEFEQFEIGGTSYDKHGVPLTDETINACKSADAILLGAVGGTKWDNVPTDLKPEQGLLKIRKESKNSKTTTNYLSLALKPTGYNSSYCKHIKHHRANHHTCIKFNYFTKEHNSVCLK